MKFGAANYLMGGRVLGVFLQPQRRRRADEQAGERLIAKFRSMAMLGPLLEIAINSCI